MAHMYDRGAHRTAAWHKGLTNHGEFTDPRNFDQCRIESGHTFTIDKVPAYHVTEGLDGDGNFVATPVQVPGQFHLRRSDDARIVSPSTVTDRYSILQPGDMVDSLRPFIDQGWATIDGIFSLYQGGSDVICLALDGQQDVQVAGDSSVYSWYMVAQNFHGRGCARAKLTGVRVVCNNTTTAAFGTAGRGKGSANWAIRHTGKVADRFETAARQWTEAREAIGRIVTALGLFASFPCDVPATMAKILKVDEESSTRARNRLDTMVSFARAPENWTGANALSVYNGVTGWATHDGGGKAGADPSKRFESHMDGDRGRVEQSAVDYLLELTGA